MYTDLSVFYIYSYLCLMEKHSDTRERILKTAQRLFYDQGYNNTGINQIIEEAGIAKASLYQHFKSKDDLLVAYLKRDHQERMRNLHQRVAQFDNPVDKLGAMFDYRISRAEAQQFRGCGFIRIQGELDRCFARDQAQQAIRQYKTEVLQLFRSLVATLPLRAGTDPDVLSERIFLIYEGGQVNSTVMHSVEPLRQAKALALELIA